MYETVIAIDLETTGVDPYRDHIIEIGAAVWRAGAVTDRFTELVAAPVPLSPGIIKLTGISPAMLEGARPLDAVLADFLEFLPAEGLCIAHNAAFERAFLRHATRDRFDRVVLDTVELSRICLPHLASHSLESLNQSLNLPERESHRALADCERLLDLWTRLIERALQIPAAVVREINYLLGLRSNHPYREFFQKLEAELLTRNFGTPPGSLEALYPVCPPPADRVVVEDAEEGAPLLDLEQVAGIFAPGGALAKANPQYEERACQVDMARSVAEAFNQKRHLLVEAGTGVGKSLAYLAPSVLWAKTRGMAVVVSTNTKNLQSQLYDKDLPFLRDALGIDFQTAIIKGRRNYLCLRKLMYVLRQASSELDADECMRLLNILPWSVWTETGDISENIVFDRPGFHNVWAKLSTVGDECLGRGCRCQRRCFLQRARMRAQAADIVVANHSLVFADLGMQNPVLPEHRQLIFDEAHNLEEAATSHLSVEVSSGRLRFVLGRLSRSGRRGGSTGLLTSVQSKLEQAGGLNLELREQAVAFLGETQVGLDDIEALMHGFFAALAGPLGAREGDDEGECVRFSPATQRPSVWDPIRQAKEALLSGIARIRRGLEGLTDSLKEIKDDGLEYQREFVRDLEAGGQWLAEVMQDLEFVLAADNENYVYWVEPETGKGGGARAWAAPKRVGQLLHDQLYAKRETIVFCSATMSVRGKFDFLKRRLGIELIENERRREMNAGTPFDYRKQCLIAVPLFLSEPGERGHDYTGELAILLSEIFRRTQGRALTLFTSYDMLRKVDAKLKDYLLGDGIQVLSQGLSGSRENITAVFKQDRRSVLLGTHSFWEGVDVVGSALSCLTIARLPFQVFTDPLVAARREQIEADGDDSFLGYMLPCAVIRFRQGFGRLIRHRNDRGVAIIADRRIISKRYGQWFRDSLPAPTVSFPDREEFLDAIREFLDAPAGTERK